MNKKTKRLLVVDECLQPTGSKKNYVSPACCLVAIEDEGCICASLTLDPQGSSEPSNWDNNQTVDGDHDEWFGTSTEVAP